MWIPADLSSASVVDTSPDATPCGATVCDGIDLSNGSNVLMLSWEDDAGSGAVTTTNVSYHFAPSGDGQTFELSRVQCVDSGSGWSCSSRVVLRDLPGPPGGEPFVPGVANLGELPSGRHGGVHPARLGDHRQRAAGSLTPSSEDQVANESDRKDANRVIVTINGGGDAAGAGGGINQISITAGGTVRTSIDANSVQGAPTFTEACSRCGGPMTLVVDESGSIGERDRRRPRRCAHASSRHSPARRSSSRSCGSTRGRACSVDALAPLLRHDEPGRRRALLAGDRGPVERTVARTGRRRCSARSTTQTARPPPIIPRRWCSSPTACRRATASPGDVPGVLPGRSRRARAAVADSTAARTTRWPSTGPTTSPTCSGRACGSSASASAPASRQSSGWMVDPGAGYRTVVGARLVQPRPLTRLGTYQARYQKKNSGDGPWYWVNKATYDRPRAIADKMWGGPDREVSTHAADTRSADDGVRRSTCHHPGQHGGVHRQLEQSCLSSGVEDLEQRAGLGGVGGSSDGSSQYRTSKV